MRKEPLSVQHLSKKVGRLVGLSVHMLVGLSTDAFVHDALLPFPLAQTSGIR